jgi:hypothetical protein
MWHGLESPVQGSIIGLALSQGVALGCIKPPLQGSTTDLALYPRALPWAVVSRPFRAEENLQVPGDWVQALNRAEENFQVSGSGDCVQVLKPQSHSCKGQKSLVRASGILMVLPRQRTFGFCSYGFEV